MISSRWIRSPLELRVRSAFQNHIATWENHGIWRKASFCEEERKENGSGRAKSGTTIGWWWCSLFLIEKETEGLKSQAILHSHQIRRKTRIPLCLTLKSTPFRVTLKLYGVWREDVIIFIEHIPCAGHLGNALQESYLILLINPYELGILVPHVSKLRLRQGLWLAAGH